MMEHLSYGEVPNTSPKDAPFAHLSYGEVPNTSPKDAQPEPLTTQLTTGAIHG
jgi:hypothetical protein